MQHAVEGESISPAGGEVTDGSLLVRSSSIHTPVLDCFRYLEDDEDSYSNEDWDDLLNDEDGLFGDDYDDYDGDYDDDL